MNNINSSSSGSTPPIKQPSLSSASVPGQQPAKSPEAQKVGIKHLKDQQPANVPEIKRKINQLISEIPANLTSENLSNTLESIAQVRTYLRELKKAGESQDPEVKQWEQQVSSILTKVKESIPHSGKFKVLKSSIKSKGGAVEAGVQTAKVHDPQITRHGVGRNPVYFARLAVLKKGSKRVKEEEHLAREGLYALGAGEEVVSSFVMKEMTPERFGIEPIDQRYLKLGHSPVTINRNLEEYYLENLKNPREENLYLGIKSEKDFFHQLLESQWEFKSITRDTAGNEVVSWKPTTFKQLKKWFDDLKEQDKKSSRLELRRVGESDSIPLYKHFKQKSPLAYALSYDPKQSLGNFFFIPDFANEEQRKNYEICQSKQWPYIDKKGNKILLDFDDIMPMAANAQEITQRCYDEVLSRDPYRITQANFHLAVSEQNENVLKQYDRMVELSGLYPKGTFYNAMKNLDYLCKVAFTQFGLSVSQFDNALIVQWKLVKIEPKENKNITPKQWRAYRKCTNIKWPITQNGKTEFVDFERFRDFLSNVGFHISKSDGKQKSKYKSQLKIIPQREEVEIDEKALKQLCGEHGISEKEFEDALGVDPRQLAYPYEMSFIKPTFITTEQSEAYQKCVNIKWPLNKEGQLRSFTFKEFREEVLQNEELLKGIMESEDYLREQGVSKEELKAALSVDPDVISIKGEELSQGDARSLLPLEEVYKRCEQLMWAYKDASDGRIEVVNFNTLRLLFRNKSVRNFAVVDENYAVVENAGLKSELLQALTDQGFEGLSQNWRLTSLGMYDENNRPIENVEAKQFLFGMKLLKEVLGQPNLLKIVTDQLDKKQVQRLIAKFILPMQFYDLHHENIGLVPKTNESYDKLKDLKFSCSVKTSAGSSASLRQISFANLREHYLKGEVEPDKPIVYEYTERSGVVKKNALLEDLPELREALDFKWKMEIKLFDFDKLLSESNMLQLVPVENEMRTLIPIRVDLLALDLAHEPLDPDIVAELKKEDTALLDYLNYVDAPIRKRLSKEDQKELDQILNPILSRPEYSLRRRVQNYHLAIEDLRNEFAKKMAATKGPLWDFLVQKLSQVKTKEGETLEGIAKRYKQKVEVLKEKNPNIAHIASNQPLKKGTIVHIDYTLGPEEKIAMAKQLFPRATFGQRQAAIERQQNRMQYFADYEELSNITGTPQEMLDHFKRLVDVALLPLSTIEKKTYTKRLNQIKQTPDIEKQVNQLKNDLMKACQPTCFNLAKVMFPLLADVYELNKELPGVRKTAFYGSDYTHPLEATIKETREQINLKRRYLSLTQAQSERVHDLEEVCNNLEMTITNETNPAIF